MFYVSAESHTIGQKKKYIVFNLNVGRSINANYFHFHFLSLTRIIMNDSDAFVFDLILLMLIRCLWALFSFRGFLFRLNFYFHKSSDLFAYMEKKVCRMKEGR